MQHLELNSVDWRCFMANFARHPARLLAGAAADKGDVLAVVADDCAGRQARAGHGRTAEIDFKHLAGEKLLCTLVDRRLKQNRLAGRVDRTPDSVRSRKLVD